jgi:hypothetical protein
MRDPSLSSEAESQSLSKLENLQVPKAMKGTAIELLVAIKSAADGGELERSVIFANGFTLGIDRDHVSEADVLTIQSAFLDAYTRRRAKLLSS